MISLRELDEIESQLDSTVPYYLPRLIKSLRALLQAAAAPRPGPSAGECIHSLDKLAEWFETVNQKITDTDAGRQPPSYAELWEDIQHGLRHVGYLLTLADPPVAPASPETPRSDYDRIAACLDCGLPYSDFPLDVVLPRAQWLDIHPEGENGLLCAACIVKRAAKIPGCTVAHMVLEITPAASPRPRPEEPTR